MNGTLSALRAASRAPSVKRVVLLSSAGAVIDPTATGPRVYDETCWNEADPAEVARLGRDASGVSKYRVSKICAERAAWKFYEDARTDAEAGGSELGWDLTVLNPPWVFGPVLHDIRGGPETLNASNVCWYMAVVHRQFTGNPCVTMLHTPWPLRG